MDTYHAGLYLHIPICRSKCPYCDFYSLRASQGVEEKYLSALINKIKSLSRIYYNSFNSVYIGGGTPSVLGTQALSEIIKSVKDSFPIENDSEITVECNPFDAQKDDFDFELLAMAGVNRISMGMQSANDSERRTLGRLSNTSMVGKAVKRAQAAGIQNISLDLMLAIPDQTADTLKKSIDFCVETEAKHISAYLLKIEENTKFYQMRNSLNLPNEDAACNLYFTACDELEKAGYMQYEISNFAKAGFESRHNLKYWNCDEYLGIGPSAHSFWNKKRFYYERDIEKFISGNDPIDDGDGGSFEEYAMLRLRLTDGLIFDDVLKRLGHGIPEFMLDKARLFEKNGLTKVTPDRIALTREGFLVSNAIIAELL